MPHQKPKVLCPRCNHEFEIGGTPKICRWCGIDFSGRGDRRYCSAICKIKANNWRAWRRQKRDPEYVKKRRDYMRNYMRTYRGPKNAS